MEITLHVELLDDWHCGSGRGSGSLVDATIDRDDLGLPYVPGRMLKGLLREACVALADFKAADSADVDRWFGPRLQDGDGDRYRFHQGQLAISDARLPPDVATWLAGDGAEHVPHLTRTISATALDEGVAKGHSLRSFDVAVPMLLEAHIEGPDDGNWLDVMRRAAQLVHAVGAHRTRGLGRCELRIGGAENA